MVVRLPSKQDTPVRSRYPAPDKTMKIFLSVPFSSRVDESGQVNAEYRHAIEDLLTNLRQQSHEVFCALEHTNWIMGGVALPEEELKKDLEEIDRSDKLIILLEERVSSGVQLENGYAFAKGKELEIYQIGKASWSNIAFGRLSGIGNIPVQSILDFVDQAKHHNSK